MKKNRKIKNKRITKETNVSINLNLDGRGTYKIKTGIDFFDHILSQVAKHGALDLEIKAKGDKMPDLHHMVEDVGIVFGESLKKALSNKTGIKRFGFASATMDESLVNVSLDLSGRSYLVFDLPLNKKKVGNFDEDLIEEFFRAFVNSSSITLHIHKVCGKNPHHLIESTFKSFGVALKDAVMIINKKIPSTKGSL
ncbi:MAG: imidazoleglycerol-phosphate dehydratase HisB [Candidatus Firestonebacteria bacterium]